MTIPPKLADMDLASSEAFHFTVDDLLANREGTMTEGQKEYYQIVPALAPGGWFGLLFYGTASLFTAFLFLTQVLAGNQSSRSLNVLISVVAGLISIVMLVLTFFRWRFLSKNPQPNRVHSFAGAYTRAIEARRIRFWGRWYTVLPKIMIGERQYMILDINQTVPLIVGQMYTVYVIDRAQDYFVVSIEAIENTLSSTE